MIIDIITDNSLIIPEYIIDLKNKSNKTIELVEHREKLKNLEQQKVANKFSANKENKKFYKKNYKKKFFKKDTK
jgi:ribonuclease E